MCRVSVSVCAVCAWVCAALIVYDQTIETYCPTYFLMPASTCSLTNGACEELGSSDVASEFVMLAPAAAPTIIAVARSSRLRGCRVSIQLGLRICELLLQRLLARCFVIRRALHLRAELLRCLHVFELRL